MANYIIIGGDGKEYGPVSEADLRQWITEGRLAASSLAKGEGDAEFRPLSKFPELAANFGMNPLHMAGTPPPIEPPKYYTPPIAPPNVGNSQRAAALDQVQPSAITLMVVAGLGMVLSLWQAVKLIFFGQAINLQLAELMTKYPQLQDAEAQKTVQKIMAILYGPLGIGTNIFAALMSGFIFWSAWQMRKLKYYELAFSAAIVAMVPCLTNCCSWVVSLPVGIWALVILNRSSVKSQFE